MPCEGAVFLFSGRFTPRIKEELAVRQQARELAGQLRQSQPPRYHSPGQSRAFPRAQAAPPRANRDATGPGAQQGRTGRPRGAPIEGDTADSGVSAVIARRPRAAVAFDSSPRALGPPDMRVGGLLAGLSARLWAAITERRLRALRDQRRLQHRTSRPSPRRRHRLAPPPACHPT